ncbi:MAG: hypothetical protein R3298_07605 [Gammaproteobacteria bacterium]|nr:hypothetical protein [Gammaproteobacteria bacterium]
MRPSNETVAPRRAPSRAALALILLLAPAVTPAAHYDFAARNATVTALLESGERLDVSQQGRRALELVRKVQAEAVEAYASGATEKGYERLDQAYVLIQSVVRNLAVKPEVSTEAIVPARLTDVDPELRDARFDALSNSVTALRAAYRSIREETREPGTDLEPEIDRRVQVAHAARDAGRQADAMRELKGAYLLLQSEIVRLRSGQTLVRELKFVSDAEEYAYEVDRHDSHLLLVDLLLSGSAGDSGEAASIRASVDESMRLHWIAHKHAAAGEYRKAIAWLELASDTLITLIRSHGHDIPR